MAHPTTGNPSTGTEPLLHPVDGGALEAADDARHVLSFLRQALSRKRNLAIKELEDAPPSDSGAHPLDDGKALVTAFEKLERPGRHCCVTLGELEMVMGRTLPGGDFDPGVFGASLMAISSGILDELMEYTSRNRECLDAMVASQISSQQSADRVLRSIFPQGVPETVERDVKAMASEIEGARRHFKKTALMLCKARRYGIAALEPKEVAYLTKSKTLRALEDESAPDGYHAALIQFVNTYREELQAIARAPAGAHR